MKVAINEIKINPGRRPANLDGIKELARSISEIGLLNPIVVGQEHTLIAGLHRLEAVKMLGWTEIECNICTPSTPCRRSWPKLTRMWYAPNCP